MKSNLEHLLILPPSGDLFEREEDIADPNLWKYVAGSENSKSQEKHRNQVLLLADYIVPGHGPMFKVTSEMKKTARAFEESEGSEDADCEAN